MNISAVNRVAFAIIITTLMVVSSGCIVRVSDPVIEETDLGSATKILGSNTAGAIELQGESERIGTIHIRTEKRVSTYSFLGVLNPNRYANSLQTTERLENGTLVFSTENIPPFYWFGFRITPEVKRTISSPVAIDVELDQNAGNLQISNISGNVSANVDAGTCTLNGIAGPVQATVEAGSLYAQMIIGPINANVDAGEITISSDGLIGDNYVDVNAGSITVSLPSSANFRYRLNVDVGEINANPFNVGVSRGNAVGAQAQGCSQGNCDNTAYIEADVDFGEINLVAR